MDSPRLDPTPTPTRPGEPDLDLYTIPSSSSWFTWYDIHETEKTALKEFFDGTSITRTPKIYKEYRDFIINKYRQDPSKILTFTEIRKSLVADVTLLHKVFNFLSHWGLINFSANRPEPGLDAGLDPDANAGLGPGFGKLVKVEEGAPNGVRVVAMPNATKPISLPQSAQGEVVVSNGESVVTKLPPLASYSDVFEEGIRGGNGGVWSEEEILALLEAVMKYGDDWEVVAQSVKTKSKEDCIAKIIELPFADLMLSSKANGEKKVPGGLGKRERGMKAETSEKFEELEDREMNDEGLPLKRQRAGPGSLVFDDPGSVLMKQVARITSIASPDIVAPTAEAAVAAICEETSCPREVFDGFEEDFPINGGQSPTLDSELERDHEVKDSEMEERPDQSGSQETSHLHNDIPLSLRLRAAIATSLGAAATHAKLLADQEEREIENLMAIITDTQMRKLQHKVKCFDDLELLMEKEHAELEEIKESLTEERIDVLSRTISSGISKLKDHNSVKSQSGTVF